MNSRNAVRLVSFELSDAQILLEQLRLAAQSDGASPRSFALLLRKASKTKAWTAEFPSFRAYLLARETDGGLGLNEQAFLHIAELGGVEKLARELLYSEVPEIADRGGDRRSEEFQNKPTTLKPGTTAERTVARLKRDDPALAERVVRGEMTPNAAAREKGWRRPRIVLSTPERVAESLRKYMSADDIAKLIAVLVSAADLSANQGDGSA